ncbi:MAG: ribonuclease P protein component [Nocardioides sp.]
MLSAAHRLTDAASFRETTRRGRRASARTLVVHLQTSDVGGPARIGFVVSRAVGNSVVRNRVQRRLRHAMRAGLSTLPGASVLVVRALPAAATASYRELETDLQRCLDRCVSAA